MSESDIQIPPSTLRRILEDKGETAVILLMRHSARDELPANDVGYSLPITARGWEIAQQLGVILGNRLKSIYTSPLSRCVQTAEALKLGAGNSCEIKHDRSLGDPGIFVFDGHLAFTNWKNLGHEGVMAHMVKEETSLPGMVNTRFGAHHLIQRMLYLANGEIGFHVFVTHDTLVTATVAKILDKPLSIEGWPLFLESAFFWKEGKNLVAAYRETIQSSNNFPNIKFDEPELIDFARIEVGLTIGFNCNAHFFVAGGAFKTLISGKPARDLDVWAASEIDRQLIVEALLAQGAKRLEENQYHEKFVCRNRVVDVPKSVNCDSLDALFERFDIALSAVGVEFNHRQAIAAHVHSSLSESLLKREIKLLHPLRNPKYVLTTLERMFRYGSELNFSISESDINFIWNFFESQETTMRQGMIERFLRTSIEPSRILEELKRRNLENSMMCTSSDLT